jgi:aspartyl-tRNA(Asn)/glutamyl-tRNA(Gln) amidotransferase subunit B
MFKTGGQPEAIMRNLGIEQVDDEVTLKKAIQEVMEEKSFQVEEYQAGKYTLLQFFIGQVMAKTKGRANPEKVKKLLESFLK